MKPTGRSHDRELRPVRERLASSFDAVIKELQPDAMESPYSLIAIEEAFAAIGPYIPALNELGPVSYEAVINGKNVVECGETMDQEMQQHKENGIFELVSLPAARPSIQNGPTS